MMQEFYDRIEEKKDWKFDLTQSSEVIEKLIPEAEVWLPWF